MTVERAPRRLHRRRLLPVGLGTTVWQREQHAFHAKELGRTEQKRIETRTCAHGIPDAVIHLEGEGFSVYQQRNKVIQGPATY